LDEVNFWQPGGRSQFRVLQPGELFLFKLHSPNNFIVGGGLFGHASIVPISLAREAFGDKNGARRSMKCVVGWLAIGASRSTFGPTIRSVAAFWSNRSSGRGISGFPSPIAGRRALWLGRGSTPEKRTDDFYGTPFEID
jgi:hypothetical protein